MTNMTSKALPPSVWTPLHAAVADGESFGVANNNGTDVVTVRVGQTATANDAANAGSVDIPPRDDKSFVGLKTGDLSFGRPLGNTTVFVTLWE